MRHIRVAIVVVGKQ